MTIMERARVLKWRMEQQAVRARQVEEEARSRASARIVRPLIEARLPALIARLGAAMEPQTALPRSKKVSDRCSVIFFEPIRDYLTTKAFTISPLSGIFVFHIEPQQMRLELLCPRYRRRWRFVGDEQTGRWQPPGDYIASECIASASWTNDDEAPAAVDALFAQVEASVPFILRLTAAANSDARRRVRATLQSRLTLVCFSGLYILIMAVLLAFCLIAMYGLAINGPVLR